MNIILTLYYITIYYSNHDIEKATSYANYQNYTV